jgi:hypothetical protein
MRKALSVLALLSPVCGGCAAALWLAPKDAVHESSGVKSPFREPVTAGQLVFHADFRLPPGHRMVAELVSERQLICDRLGVPAGSEPIHVFLFGEEAAYRAHVAREFPGFPERRAIFVETDVLLCVYAHWSDRVADDLRHEVSHGYLHSTVPNLPLWLDEGLAEYFEVGRGRQGVNQPHVDLLLAQCTAGTWRPNLQRLEQLVDAGAMTQVDYAEAWLWVHMLLAQHPPGDPQEPIAAYLAALRARTPPKPLSATLAERLPEFGAAERAAIHHLESLAP